MKMSILIFEYIFIWGNTCVKRKKKKEKERNYYYHSCYSFLFLATTLNFMQTNIRKIIKNYYLTIAFINDNLL